MDEEKLCIVCGIKAPLKCSGCSAVGYCSKLHQKLDWSKHKLNCQLFQVEWDPQIGHHLVASRDIQPCEIILREVPLVVGPSMVEGPAICVGCATPLNGKSVPCPNCRWPMCGQKKCWKEGSHHDLGECSLLKAADPSVLTGNFATQVTKEVHPSIMYLRYLGLKKRDPAKWKKLMNLKHCGRDHQLKQEELMGLIAGILQLVKEWVPNDDSVSPESIIKLFTATYCNAIYLPAIATVHNLGLYGIYPMGSLIDHSCLANATKIIANNGKFIVKAALPIAKGSRITINYSKVLRGTIQRRNQLKLTRYLFGPCGCERCKDPTELGSYISGIYCVKCTNGILLPEHPLNEETNWLCNKCSDRQPPTVIERKLALIQKDFDSLNSLSIAELESLMNKYKKVLHPHHYLLCEAMCILLDSYTRAEKIGVSFPNKGVLTRDLLGTLDTISPGMHRLRGVLLCHLFHCLVDEASKMDHTFLEKHHVRQPSEFFGIPQGVLREAYEIMNWGGEETAESSTANKYAKILESLERQILRLKRKEQKMVVT